MFVDNPGFDGWTVRHQEMHTLLWASFLDFEHSWQRKLLLKRYHPFNAKEVNNRLLDHHSGDDDPDLPRLRDTFVKLALWSVAPNFYGDDDSSPDGGDDSSRDGDDDFSNDGGDDSAPESGDDSVDLARFQGKFRELFGYDVAAQNNKGFDRMVVPALPEIGIETVTARIEIARRLVKARVESVVLTPFSSLKEFVCPSRWVSSPFWAVPPGSSAPGPNSIEAKVRLPGGWVELDARSPPKERKVRLDLEIGMSSFGSRIDYSLKESAPKPELGECRGFLTIEKLAGRPGACKVTAEREARFCHFNHYHFRSETLMYWLASDLVAFAEDAKRPEQA